MNKIEPKAAIYYRSSIRNDKTIETQRKQLETYAVERGIHSSMTHSVLGELLISISNNELDTVIINSSDRLSRNIEYLKCIIQKISSKRTKLIILNTLKVIDNDE